MSERLTIFYTYAVVAAVTAIAGPQDWPIWLLFALAAPMFDWLGGILSRWIGAERLGVSLRDKLFGKRR